jgi:hypothetical protein
MTKNPERIIDDELASLHLRAPILIVGHISVLYNLHASLIEGEMGLGRKARVEKAFAIAIQDFDRMSSREKFFYLRYMFHIPTYLYAPYIDRIIEGCEAEAGNPPIVSLCNTLSENVSEYMEKSKRK